MQGTGVDIATPDGVADAYVTGTGERGAVLFIMDAIGLRPRIEEMADRIAERGYVVLAPNVFYRAGRAPVLEIPDFADPGSRDRFMGEVGPLIRELTPEVSARDGAVYLDDLAQRAPGRVGITGYCMGARMGLRIAAAHPDRVSAVGGFHGGGLVTDADDSPHRSAGDLRAELYFGHADNDRSMTAEQIATLDAALDAAGARYRSEVYDGAKHGYTMSDMAAYDEAACERHFTELFALLERA
jgi:carboxymethylenebutenolidase